MAKFSPTRSIVIIRLTSYTKALSIESLLVNFVVLHVSYDPLCNLQIYILPDINKNCIQKILFSLQTSPLTSGHCQTSSVPPLHLPVRIVLFHQHPFQNPILKIRDVWVAFLYSTYRLRCLAAYWITNNTYYRTWAIL